MTEQPSNRRGFIKGIVAGIAGAFFALRGAAPAEAASGDAIRYYTVKVDSDPLYWDEEEEWVIVGRAVRRIKIGKSSMQAILIVGQDNSRLYWRYTDAKGQQNMYRDPNFL